MTNKTVKIDFKTFYRLIRYFLLYFRTEELYEAIKIDLEQKTDNLIKHDTYTKYKTADTEKDKELYRQKYLDMVGMHEDWRW